MLSSGKIAATGQPIALILMRAFERAPVASPGDSARFCSAPAWLPSAWSICGDKGLGLTPTASALWSACRSVDQLVK
jgi:hypothetical protein